MSATRGYVLFFGSYAEEEGFRTMEKACKQLPEIPFVFVGSDPLEKEIEKVENIANVGF